MSRRGNCHDNAVAESFFQLLKRERIKKRSTERGKKPAAIFLITSKCFITVSVGMVQAIRCHRQNMKTSIINGSEVSRLSVAIQAFCFLPHNTVTNHLHVMRQKASSATSIIPGRCYFLPGISTLYAA
jgi:transposase InsO family protein